MHPPLDSHTFVEAALSDLKLAEEMLASRPEIAGADLYTSLVAGDGKRLEQADVHTKGGPRDWAPLLYVCFSLFAAPHSTRADELLQAARMLLGRGADPNGSYIHEQWPESPLSCLYGAAGLNNNPALAIALLEASANPNDSESLYHSTEHADLRCMRVLLEYGASAAGTNALKHMLDWENREGLSLLLRAGADPNEQNEQGETSLHWAVWRGRSVPVISQLLDSGAAMDTRRRDGRTAYAMAMVSGQIEVAAWLQARGAKTELSAVDRYLVDPEGFQGELPDFNQPETRRLLPDLAIAHRTSAVGALLKAGAPVDTRGELGGTALHHACWRGYADLVELLLDHGASFTVEDTQFHGTPPGWLGHGMQNCHEGGGDYPEVARLLRAAGATIPQPD